MVYLHIHVGRSTIPLLSLGSWFRFVLTSAQCCSLYAWASGGSHFLEKAANCHYVFVSSQVRLVRKCMSPLAALPKGQTPFSQNGARLLEICTIFNVPNNRDVKT